MAIRAGLSTDFQSEVKEAANAASEMPSATMVGASTDSRA